MGSEGAAPCRHAGAAPQSVIDRVSKVIEELAREESFLAGRGLTPQEYTRGLPAAIESLRGSKAASSAEKRKFLTDIFQAMLARGLISRLALPDYGDDTVYRLTLDGFGDVAVIQKGCPDGAHSSVRWSAPSWARESYLWWLCSSLNSEPGEHVAKGVNRLRQRFLSAAPDTIDGVIFHNNLCGSPERPCPKMDRGLDLGDLRTPPPCVYVMPNRQRGVEDWNWTGTQQRVFPPVLLSMFGIGPDAAPAFTGHVGFRRRGPATRTTITSRFGPGRTTSDRS